MKTMWRRVAGVCTLVTVMVSLAAAQAPDGNAMLRAAGVEVGREGAEGAFDAGLTAPPPVPAAAFPALIIGMGPVGPRSRVRNAYAYGVLAGRSGRNVPVGGTAGAGVALLQMITAEERSVRVAGTRVAGFVFAAPIDGKTAPQRPNGLVEAVVLALNVQNPEEQAAAMEAIGLLGETGAVPMLSELYRAYRERNNRPMAGRALEALSRIGHSQSAPLAQALVTDGWGDRTDFAGYAASYARERFLQDGSRRRLEAATDDKTFGPQVRAYLAELGQPRP
jgi:hypothetical protein